MGSSTNLTLLLVGLSLGALACDCEAASAPASEATAQGPTTSPPADPLGPTITPDVRPVMPEGGKAYTLSRFRFDLSTTTIDVVDLAFERTLSDALEESGAQLAINGGYWDTELAPEGLTRVAGEELAEFSRSLGGGVLVVDDGVARVLDAEAPDLDVPSDADFAQQCMPRIVVDGALNIRRDDGRHADRTALCLRDEGRTLDVYVARGEDPDGHGGPTLWTFGEELVAEGCESALNLDGGGSTGAVWRGADGITRLPPRVALRLALLLK